MADDFKFSEHADKYPAVIPRAQVQKYFPWISAKRLANLDNCGEGPANAIKNGRAILYPIDSFLRWLDDRTRPQRSSKDERNPDHTPTTKKSTPSTVNRRGRKTKHQEIRERRGK